MLLLLIQLDVSKLRLFSFVLKSYYIIQVQIIKNTEFPNVSEEVIIEKSSVPTISDKST